MRRIALLLASVCGSARVARKRSLASSLGKGDRLKEKFPGAKYEEVPAA